MLLAAGILQFVNGNQHVNDTILFLLIPVLCMAKLDYSKFNGLLTQLIQLHHPLANNLLASTCILPVFSISQPNTAEIPEMVVTATVFCFSIIAWSWCANTTNSPMSDLL